MNFKGSSHDAGATLLTTLFIVMAMSTAAFAATNVLTQSIRATRDMDTSRNIEWLARSAAAGGEVILRQHDGSERILFHGPVDIPLPAGPSRVSFQDATNCFNLNSLAMDTEGTDIDPSALSAYQKLLVTSGITETDAERLVSTLADWIDMDASARSGGAEDVFYMNRAVPHFAANRPLMTISELRAIDGYSPEVVRLLQGRVCAGTPAQPSVLNVNSLEPADAPLLYALAPEQAEWNEIAAVIESRPVGGWASAEDFAASFGRKSDGTLPTFKAALVTAPAIVEARFVLSDRIGALVYHAIYKREGESGWTLISLARMRGDE